MGDGVVAHVVALALVLSPHEGITGGCIDVSHHEDLVNCHVVATVSVRSSVGFHGLPESVAFCLVLGSGFVAVHLHGVLQGSLGVGDDDVLDHGFGGGIVGGLVACLKSSKSVDHGLLGSREGV